MSDAIASTRNRRFHSPEGEGCYSEKTGKSYDAKAVMEDDGH